VVDVKGNFNDFTDPVKLLNGTTVDIETYQLGRSMDGTCCGTSPVLLGSPSGSASAA